MGTRVQILQWLHRRAKSTVSPELGGNSIPAAPLYLLWMKAERTVANSKSKKMQMLPIKIPEMLRLDIITGERKKQSMIFHLNSPILTQTRNANFLNLLGPECRFMPSFKMSCCTTRLFYISLHNVRCD